MAGSPTGSHLGSVLGAGNRAVHSFGGSDGLSARRLRLSGLGGCQRIKFAGRPTPLVHSWLPPGVE